MIAFLRIYVCCILKLMHLLTFIRIFSVAFGTRCIHVHLNASKFGCIFIACCILVHSSHKMHSHAFFVCCILYMPHLNAFQHIPTHSQLSAFWMCCILPVMHLCAFLCISVHLGGKIPDLRTIWMSAGARSTRFMMRKNAHECTLMHTNASECARIHQGPHILTQEEPSGLKAKLTWTGMGWTGCGRAILPWGVPMEHPCATTCHPSLHTNWYTSVHTRVNASA